MDQQLQESIAAAKAERAIEVKAVLNVNGQTDAGKEPDAQAYAQAQQNLIEHIRRIIGGPETAYINIRMHQGGWRHEGIVRQAQMGLKDDGLAWIDTDDIPRPDKFHYTAEGNALLGQRLAEAVMAMPVAQP
jgi:hypothetical protein